MLLRCYPKITDWIYFTFNESPSADFRFLPLYSYGFWVAVGFFVAATLAVKEMKRREALGVLTGVEKEVTEGKVSIRKHGGEDLGSMLLEDFIQYFESEVAKHFAV